MRIVVPEVKDPTAVWSALSVETVTMFPLGDGKGGALQACVNTGAAFVVLKGTKSKIRNVNILAKFAMFVPTESFPAPEEPAYNFDDRFASSPVFYRTCILPGANGGDDDGGVLPETLNT